MSLRAELLAPEDIAQACQLFERVFGSPVTQASWRWKYALGPRLSGVNAVVRNQQGQLLGHAGASVFPGVGAAVSLPMAQICDVMVDPQQRGGLERNGVYGLLMQTLQAGLQRLHPGVYGYGFAGIRPFKLGRRMGFYRNVHECRAAYFEAPPSPAPGWREWSWRAHPAPFDGAWLDRIWHRLSARQLRPLVARTAAYLQWRYASHPTHSYRCWALRHWGRERGWLVTRAMPGGDVCVVDALWPQDLEPVRAALALQRACAVDSGAGPRLFAWFLETPQSRLQEPIMGCEVRVDGWHDELPRPLFQPGDTDVF